MGKKLGLDAAYANLGKGYLQHPVINSVKPKPKPTKAMNGGMMQGYGAARTSGMGLEDQSLPPGKMVRAKYGKMAKMNRGGGMDAGAAQGKADFRARVMKLAKRNATEDRITKADIENATRRIKGLMNK